MLAFQLHRLRDLAVDHLVVATSDLPTDDEVERVAHEAGVPVVRGSETDVLGRYVLALSQHPADIVVRLTGDCPLSDPTIVEAAVALHHRQDADYTSNVFPRTFPKGLDVEVIRADALRVADAEAVTGPEREHVTPFLYRHPERFRLANLRSGLDLGEERWTVDTTEDLDTVRQIVARVGGDGGFSWTEALAIVGRTSRPTPGALGLRPADMTDEVELLRWRNDPVTRQNSHEHAVVDPHDHRRWMTARLEDPATRLQIAVLDGEMVGQVRVDVEDAVGTVSITIAPERRGEGLAKDVLRALQDQLEGDVQIDALVAEVSPANDASRRSFLSAGFAPMAATADLDRFTWTNESNR